MNRQVMDGNPATPGMTPAPAPQTGGATAQSTEFAETEANSDKLKLLIYDENNYTNMMAMFQEGGIDSYYENMAITVNGLMDEMEARFGEQSDVQLAALTLIAVGMISDDLVKGDVFPDLTSEDVHIALSNAFKTWSDGHGGRSDMEDAMKQLAMQAQQEQAAGGGVLDENVVLGTGGVA